MNLLIVTDAYAPSRTSAAVLLEDLAKSLINDGHSVSVIVPSSSQLDSIAIKIKDSIEIISVKAFQTKDISYARRLLAEIVNPFLIRFHLWKSINFKSKKYDGVLWYSPSIFWTPLVKRCQKYFKCPSYLILRDIFPDWALDLEILKKGVLYNFLAWIALSQYKQATWIGLQSPNNVEYFQKKYPQFKEKSEVLWNWIGEPVLTECSIQIKDTKLAGKKIAVYAGNVGIAQGKDALLSLVMALNSANQDMGFLFVGRGSEMEVFKRRIELEGISNILFFDEIPPEEIYSLYQQCDVGLLALDPRHKTHNIPGKFLSYMQAGIPVLGIVNLGNDLLTIIPKFRLGHVVTHDKQQDYLKVAECLASAMLLGALGHNLEGKRFIDKYCSARTGANQIIRALKSHKINQYFNL